MNCYFFLALLVLSLLAFEQQLIYQLNSFTILVFPIQKDCLSSENSDTTFGSVQYPLKEIKAGKECKNTHESLIGILKWETTCVHLCFLLGYVYVQTFIRILCLKMNTSKDDVILFIFPRACLYWPGHDLIV